MVIDCRFGIASGSSTKPLPTPSVRRVSSMTTRVTPALQREHAQPRDLDQVLERIGQRPEAVAHARDDLLDPVVGARRRQLLVDRDLLRDLRDVVVGHERVDLHVDDGFARVLGVALRALAGSAIASASSCA